MTYIPPTPTLPNKAVLDTVLAAFDALPVGPWSWEGYLNRNGVRHDSVNLIANQAGQPTIFTYSKTSGYLFRGVNGMQDVRELLPTQNFEKPIGALNNPAAIALQSAWMVPLLIRALRAAATAAVTAAPAAPVAGSGETAEALPDSLRWLRKPLKSNQGLGEDARKALMECLDQQTRRAEAAEARAARSALPVASEGDGQAGWVSVKERLPESFDEDGATHMLLVCIDGHSSTQGHYYTKSGKWIGAGRFGTPPNVTHWREWPAAPQPEAR